MEDLSVKKTFTILRSHYKNVSDSRLFSKGGLRSICMHAGIFGDHTNGSIAVFYKNGVPKVWVSGSSTPDLSLFKPIMFGETVAPVFADEKASAAYWIEREKANRAVYTGIIDASEH